MNCGTSLCKTRLVVVSENVPLARLDNIFGFIFFAVYISLISAFYPAPGILSSQANYPSTDDAHKTLTGGVCSSETALIH